MKRTSSGNGGNHNSGSRYHSYQAGGAPPPVGYQPPIHYAADQTRTIEDSTKTFYQADETAGNVLQKMTAQRQQLKGAHDDVWQMRQATEAAKREIQDLQQKYRRKKQRLMVLIGSLAVTDLLLLFRILQCGGNFFCHR